MIAAVTPGNKKSNPISQQEVTLKEIAATGSISIQYHREESLGMTMVIYEKLQSFMVSDLRSYLDLLWKSSVMFGQPRPAWSGMMQLVHNGKYPEKSSVIFIPMIDMNPSDCTCVYSILKYIQEYAHRHNVTPIITFDQPLWWKALMIIVTEPAGSQLNIVLCFILK